MLTFLDDPTELDASWRQWTERHDKSPVWLAEVPLETSRWVGAFVTPADVVLGLRAWDDADEGGLPGPWALFDIEKLVRMALHQSGLAFEALVAPRRIGTFEPRDIATAAVTRGILSHYLDITAPLEDGSVEPWLWRSLLTGALLGREGLVSLSLPTLCDRLEVPAQPNAQVAAELRKSLRNTSLPDHPRDYDSLNDLVVRMRGATR